METWYFGPYIIIWGFVYGATAMSSAALPLAALFPMVPLTVWAVIMGLAGFTMVWLGKYTVFERITAVLVGIMFVTVVGLAVIAAPNIPELLSGLIPLIPEGGIIYTLALAGGVGGTITLAAYGYWLREKGWITPKWMRVMRIDNTMAYVMTGIFVIAMLIVGAEVVRAAGVSLSAGDAGLIDLTQVLKDRYGDVVGVGFLIGFWAASFSSIIGVWNGVSLMFADFWGHMRKKPAGHPDTMTGGKYFKFYLLWLTFPPMILFLLGKPIGSSSPTVCSAPCSCPSSPSPSSVCSTASGFPSSGRTRSTRTSRWASPPCSSSSSASSSSSKHSRRCGAETQRRI